MIPLASPVDALSPATLMQLAPAINLLNRQLQELMRVRRLEEERRWGIPAEEDSDEDEEEAQLAAEIARIEAEDEEELAAAIAAMEAQ